MGLFPDTNPWLEVRDGDARADALYRRHYSARRNKPRADKRIGGPGRKMILLTAMADALFVWRDFFPMDGQTGINAACFRNESAILSSTLILCAEEMAGTRWPDAVRYYTYVDPRKVRSRNPGYCFLMAGWRRCGRTAARNLLVMEKVWRN